MKYITFKCKLGVVVALLCVVVAFQVAAHPHVFIKTASKFRFSHGKLSGVVVEWEFDEFFSNQVLSACDRNKDRRMSPFETKIVYNKFFKNLRHFNYFVYIWINNTSMGIKHIKNFRVFVRGRGRVVYRFFVPIVAKIGLAKKTVKLIYLDESNFVAFYAEEKSISIVGRRPVVLQALNNKRAQYHLAFKR